jgi:hypothetical protein
MRVINLNPQPTAEASGLIAQLWRALEEFRIPSPRLSVCDVDGAVEVKIEFLAPQDAESVDLAVPGLRARPLVAAVNRSRLG